MSGINYSNIECRLNLWLNYKSLLLFFLLIFWLNLWLNKWIFLLIKKNKKWNFRLPINSSKINLTQITKWNNNNKNSYINQKMVAIKKVTFHEKLDNLANAKLDKGDMWKHFDDLDELNYIYLRHAKWCSLNSHVILR